MRQASGCPMRLPVVRDEQWPGRTAVEIVLEHSNDGSSQHRPTASATFAFETENAVSPVVRKVLDVTAERFADAQARVGKQRDQRKAAGAAILPSRREETSQVFSGEPGRFPVVTDIRSTYVLGR
jgi:hypothetical protein